MRFADQLWAYVLRIVWERRTYKTAMLLGFVTTAIGLVQFALLGVFIQQGNTFPGIADYGGNVLGFLLTGSIFTGFVAICLSGFSSYVKEEQSAGTLEAVMSQPTPLTRTMVFSAVLGLVGTVLGSSAMIAIFTLAFHIPFSVNLFGAVLVLVALLFSLGGIGLAGCGVLLVTKRGDPVTWLFTTATTLLSGVMYPVSVLPGWIQGVAHMLPTTIALHGMRISVLRDGDVTAVMPTVSSLMLWALITVPVGFFVFRLGLRRSRAEGTVADH